MLRALTRLHHLFLLMVYSFAFLSFLLSLLWSLCFIFVVVVVVVIIVALQQHCSVPVERGSRSTVWQLTEFAHNSHLEHLLCAMGEIYC